LPTMVTKARDEWMPAIQERLRAVGVVPPPPAPEPEHGDEPPLVVKPQPDGSYHVEIGSGVDITPRPHGGWTLAAPREAKEEPFDLNRLASDVVGKSFAY